VVGTFKFSFKLPFPGEGSWRDPIDIRKVAVWHAVLCCCVQSHDSNSSLNLLRKLGSRLSVRRKKCGPIPKKFSLHFRTERPRIPYGEMYGEQTCRRLFASRIYLSHHIFIFISDLKLSRTISRGSCCRDLPEPGCRNLSDAIFIGQSGTYSRVGRDVMERGT